MIPAVIDLDESDDEADKPLAKKTRVGSGNADPIEHATTAPAHQVRGAPLYLNRLLDADVAGPAFCELSLQDVFEHHPSNDAQPPREVLIANFMVDLAFLMDECPSLRQVPVLTVLVGDDGCGCNTAAMSCREKRGLETRVHKPPLPLQWGTHHSKLALLLYDDCIRVCVRTFNDLFADVHCKSQALYVQDFPARSAPSGQHGEVSSDADAFGIDFKTQLKRYMRCCGGFDPDRLDRYDFSTAAVAVVASSPGYHTGSEIEEWGHMRLRRLLSSSNSLLQQWVDGNPDQGLICQFSSLGSTTPKWLQEFHSSLTGAAVPRTPSSSSVLRPQLHLVAPTVSQVRDSGEGWTAGASIPIRSSNLKSHLLQYWRRWGPAVHTVKHSAPWAARRASVAMPHVKSFCRFRVRPDRSAELAWLYVGSHNLSKAAWGELQKGGAQLCIRSYELGVLFFPGRLCVLEPDPRRPHGRFLRQKRTSDMSSPCSSRNAVFVPLALNLSSDGSITEVGGTCNIPIACPTAVPPAQPPGADDPIWAVDLPADKCGGLDRYGTGVGEREIAFYGRGAAHRRAH